MKKYFIGICLLLLPLLSIAQLPPAQAQKGIRFIEGGVGLNESEAMNADLGNWPLQIEFSQTNGKKAEWISNVYLAIKGANNIEVFSHQVDGPMILLGLSPGSYSIESSYQGQKLITRVQTEIGQHQKIDIHWK